MAAKVVLSMNLNNTEGALPTLLTDSAYLRRIECRGLQLHGVPLPAGQVGTLAHVSSLLGPSDGDTVVLDDQVWLGPSLLKFAQFRQGQPGAIPPPVASNGPDHQSTATAPLTIATWRSKSRRTDGSAANAGDPGQEGWRLALTSVSSAIRLTRTSSEVVSPALDCEWCAEARKEVMLTRIRAPTLTNHPPALPVKNLTKRQASGRYGR